MATNPEETALQTSTTSETPNTATAPPQLGEVGHVAALGEPDTSQFSPDYWASQETYTVDVYLCAPPGRYEFVQSAPFSPMEGSGQEVEEQLWSLRHDTATGKVARFFTRESTGLLNLYFTPRLTEIDLMTPTEMEESLERLAEGENPPDLDWKPRRQAGLSPPGMERLQERAEELEAAQGRGETMESLGDKWCLSVLLESSGALSGFTQSLSRLLDVAESWPDHPRVLRALEMLGVDGVGELPKLLVDTQTALDEVEARMSEGLQGGGYCNW